MKKILRYNLLSLSIILLAVITTNAQTTPVSNYTFSQYDGDYTELSGGTVYGNESNDEESFNALDLGFTFNYNGTNYTQISIQTNGFIAFGSSVAATFKPISNSSGTNNIISAFGTNLKAQSGSELMSTIEGVSPNRVFTIGWKNYKNKIISEEHSVNFQIKLFETSNKIEFVYGNFNFVQPCYISSQIGLRGNSRDDFNNRQTLFGSKLYFNWDISRAGGGYNASCVSIPNKKPAEGFTIVYEEPFSIDAGVVGMTSPERIITSPSTENININLKNYGTTTLTSSTIKWKINDEDENSFSWTGSLSPNEIAENITIGSYDFSTDNFFTIEIWSENPNSGTDQNPNNDYFKTYNATNQYCSSDLVNDEWWFIEDVLIGNIIHLNCDDYDSYTAVDYSTNFNASYSPGSNINYTIDVNSGGYLAFWIDYNDDNIFNNDSEYLGTSEYFDYTMTPSGTLSISEDAPEGMHKLRVRYIYTSEGNVVPDADDACTPLSNFMYEGDSHDYAINIFNTSTPPPCTFNPIPTNNAMDVPLNKIVEWESESATSFDIYFGTDSNPVFIANQVENYYDPGLLEEFTTYYWKIIAKNEFGNATNCETWSFTTGDQTEYCIPGNSDCYEWGDLIDDFYMVDLIHENSDCSENGYGDFTQTSYTTELVQGSNVIWVADYGSQDALAIWMDFNDDGIFNETDEFVYHTELVNGTFVHIETDDFNLPPNTPLGTHRMRVRCAYTALFSGNQSCSAIGYGETHDYNITIIEPTNAPECASAPIPEDGSSNQFMNSKLNWTANQATSYDVYFGTTTLEYLGETSEVQFDPGTLLPNTNYQWKIIAKNSAGSATGCDIWTFTTNDELTYCDYLYYGDSYGEICEWGDYIDDFSIGDLNHTGTGCTPNYGYVDYTNMVVDLAQGATYAWEAVLGINNSDHLAIWFDTNNDGTFDENECLYTSADYVPQVCTGTIAIPAIAEIGNHRMRIRVKFGGDPFAPNQACYAFTYGEAHDYTVNVIEPTQAPECAVNFAPENGASNIILNYGTLTWQADYASEFDVYFGTESNPPLVSENQINAFYDPGTLDANTTYYWKIIPSNIIGGPDDCDIISFTTSDELEYCVNLYAPGPDYNCQWGDDINDFFINDFEHTGTGCYSESGMAVDYTNMVIDLEDNHTHLWTVTTNNPDMNHFAIWIDYDDNGDFNNSNEFLYSSEELLPSSFSDTIHISASAPEGEHRMRLRLKSYNPPMSGDDACTFYDFGETHDYTVNIISTANVEKLSEEILIYPNPANNYLIIKSDISIKNTYLYNSLGHLFFSKKLNTNRYELNTADLPKGFYIIKIETEKGIVYRNIIISH